MVVVIYTYTKYMYSNLNLLYDKYLFFWPRVEKYVINPPCFC